MHTAAMLDYECLKEMRTGWAQTCVIQSPNTIANVPKP